MFGQYGVRLELGSRSIFQTTGRGFQGKRKLTRNSCRALSAVGVIEKSAGNPYLSIYHNPYALLPLAPSELTQLAKKQYRHPGPHEGQFIPWEPLSIA